jgi:hypothetical protein
MSDDDAGPIRPSSMHLPEISASKNFAALAAVSTQITKINLPT